MGLDIYLEESNAEVLYRDKITHNLSSMAMAVELYIPLWHPEEIGVNKAGELVPILKKGLLRLLSDPEKYRELNPKNGWGSYEFLVEFVTRYIIFCTTYPEATISCSI
jgi:hypothetical protein